jgi:DNA-binding MarR family transcriptional regulator
MTDVIYYKNGEIRMMPNSPPEQQAVEKFWEFFPPVWHTVRAHIHHEATENFDITVGQFHILRRIRHSADTVSKLADDKHTSRPAVSRVVDVLVNKGLVVRTQNPIDRRNVLLSLTEEGQSLMEALFSNTRQWMTDKLAILSEDELEAILVAGDALKRAFAGGND